MHRPYKLSCQPARVRLLACTVAGLWLAWAGTAVAQDVGGGTKGAVTGAAGGATTEGANSVLERCDQALGTIGVVEGQSAPWYQTLR